MRQVSGFERPVVQWVFVALGIVLIGVAASEAVALRRARTQIESLRAADLNARLEQERLQGQVAREQAARTLEPFHYRHLPPKGSASTGG